MTTYTNKNTILLTLNKWTAIASKSRNSYRYSNTSASSFLSQNMIEDSNSTHLTAIKTMFSYELSQSSNRRGEGKRTISHIEYHNSADVIPETVVNFKYIRSVLKENIQILLLSKENSPYFWENLVSLQPQAGYYRNREITQQDIDQIEYIVILRDMSNYFFDFDKKCFSFFPKELFQWYNSEYQQVRDVTSYFEETPSIAASFLNRTSPFTEGRKYTEKLTYTISSEVPSDVHFVSNAQSMKESLGTEEMGMFKYKTLLKGTGDPVTAYKSYAQESFHTGYGLFPYRTSNALTVYSDSKFENFTFYGFATFMKSATVKRYVKAKQYLSSLFKKISNFEGCYLYDSEKYTRLLKEVYKGHIQYSNGIEKVFPNEVACTKSLMISTKISKEKDFTPNLSSLLSLGKSKTYKSLKSISDSIKEVSENKEAKERKVSEHNTTKNRSSREIQDQKDRITQYEGYIRQCKERILTQEQYLSTADKVLEKTKLEIESYEKILSQLSPEKEKIYTKYKKEIEDIQIAVPEDKFTLNLNKKGIYIEDITYSTDSGNVISSRQDSSIILNTKRKLLLNENEYKLHCIKFKIVKPVVVRVDPIEKGENCPKIAVGPFYVTLTASSIHLAPLTSSCIFGYDSSSSNVWLHPHTSSRRLNMQSMDSFLTSFMTMEQNGCLGEASSAIYSAFQSQDPRQAILAAMTWITSANSSDAWGKHWKHFPRLEEINSIEKKIDLEEEERRKVLASLQDAESILQNMFEDISLPDDNRAFQNFEESAQDAVIESYIAMHAETVETESEPQVIESEVIEPQVEDPATQQADLRRAGVEGYTPLFR